MNGYNCRDLYLNLNGTHRGSETAKQVKMREARLEKYIKDYVYDKTAESVYLHLEDAIRITHITKKGSITLAILWANILQHPKNFPVDKHTYSKFIDNPTGGDRLILKAENILFTVYMSSGSLVMEGAYIYDWFTRRFKDLLDNFDESYQKTWTFIPTPSMPVSEEKTVPQIDDPNTEVEDYLLLRTKRHAVGTELDKKMDEYGEILIPGMGNMAIDQPLFEGDDLDKEKLTLTNTCVVKDGMSYVYKLWLSLLHNWLSDRETQVYIASPEIDMERLRDIIDITLAHQYKGQLEAIYTTSVCDPHNGNTLDHLKKTALKKYEDKHQTYIEYKVLHRIMLPLKRINARFIASVQQGGQTEVLVTSAGFHAKNFLYESLETVSFFKMETEKFMEQFVNPMTTQVVASIY